MHGSPQKVTHPRCNQQIVIPPYLMTPADFGPYPESKKRSGACKEAPVASIDLDDWTDKINICASRNSPSARHQGIVQDHFLVRAWKVQNKGNASKCADTAKAVYSLTYTLARSIIGSPQPNNRLEYHHKENSRNKETRQILTIPKEGYEKRAG